MDGLFCRIQKEPTPQWHTLIGIVHTITSFACGFYVTAMELLTLAQGWRNMADLDPVTRGEVLPIVETKLEEANRIRIGGSGEGGVLGDCCDQNVLIHCKG
jgi:hypothetical protein